MPITVEEQTCKRCDYKWIPRSVNLPVQCPKCHSPYWTKDRQAPKGEKKEEGK